MNPKSLLCFIIIILVFYCLIFYAIVAHSEEYSNEQIANAIRKAEGTWTYGIKTVKCETEKSCREICLKTIENNRKRYQEYGRFQHGNYLSFLASRYAPIGVRNDPKGLNKNWLNNVNFLLKKDNK